MEKWQNRYTVRKFDPSVTVAEEHITHLKNMFEHIPTQQSINDNLWITLTPEHHELKVWLLENVFNHNNETGKIEYMIQIITAPVVFLSNTFWPDIQLSSFNDARRNIGLHAGILMEESLSLGYDVATIGCTQKYWDNNDILQTEYNTVIGNIFREQIVNHTKRTEYILEPSLAVCIGKGEPLSLQEEWDEYMGYTYVPYQKKQKRWWGII